MNEDALSVLDTVGTWAAAALAAIALIGVASSWILLRELHSERTNALNYLHDHDNPPFISRGWRFGRRARLFRSIRVPDLTPYDAWAAGSPLVIPKTGEPWVLREPQAPSCRTGWARLCRLLSAYQVGQDPVKLGTGGDLVIEDGETWLPVSRYWILSLGLLGRYGNREDRGMHFRFAERMIRPDLCEQLIWTPPPPQTSLGDARRLRFEREIEMIVPTPPAPPAQIWGVTGSFQVAWRAPGTQTPRTRDHLRFKLHIKDQLGPLLSSDGATSTGQENLQFMFWLATGFLPCNIGYEAIASLEPQLDYEVLAMGENSYLPAGSGTADPVRYWQTYEYSECEGSRAFPQSLYEAGQALDIDFTLVTCLQNTTETRLLDPAEVEHIRQCAEGNLPEGTGRWLSVYGPLKYYTALFRRLDLQSLADSLLSITWQPWSYLVRKDGPNLLDAILSTGLIDAAREMNYRPAIEETTPGYCARLSKALGRASSDRWIDPDTFDQRRTADLLALVDLVKEPFPGGNHHRRVVGILYMTARSFRRLVDTLFEASTLESSSPVARLDNSSRELTWLFDNPDFHELPGGDSHSESGGDEADPGDDKTDSERMVWVHLRASAYKEYPNSSLATTHPLSIVIREDHDGLGKVRVLRMKHKDVQHGGSQDSVLTELAFLFPLKKAKRRDGVEVIPPVKKRGGEYDDLVDLEEMVEVHIMGDEYDDSPLVKKYSITHNIDERTEATHRVVSMKYKDAMDLLRENDDENTEAVDYSPSRQATSRDSDDAPPRATAGTVFQIDVPFDGNTKAETIADLTKDEVILACLWAASICALCKSSPDSKPLMSMVDQLSDVVLVS